MKKNEIFGFGDKEKNKDDIMSLERCKAGVLEFVKIITEIKKSKEIFDNGDWFFGRYERKKYGNKKYDFLQSVHFTLKKGFTTKENEVIKVVKYDSSIIFSVMKYLIYDKTLLIPVLKVNFFADRFFNRKAIVLALEDVIPKKKYFIKNLRMSIGHKKETEIVSELKRYFSVSSKRAKEYADTLIMCDEIDKFCDIFSIEQN